MSSELYTPSFADPHGALMRPGGHNVNYAEGDGPPTGFPAAGYEKGCLFKDRTNGIAYLNTGTATVAVWSKISTGGASGFTINTNDTTVGNATLTAAEIVGRVITRSGSTAAYTDTTDTAANIIAALPAGTALLASFYLYIRNTTAFPETIAGGTGVTLTGNTIVPPNSIGEFLVTYATATTVTMLGLDSSPLTTTPLLANTNITTVGNGTLTAAGIAGGLISRSGSVAAYSDATDTAANIIAALPNANIGQSWLLTVENNVPFNETITNGTGVTVSEITVIPPNSAATYLVTYTAAATVTMVGLYVAGLTNTPLLAATNLTTVGAGTITGAGIAGGVTNRTGSTAAFTDTVDTAANIIAALPNAQVGQSFWWTYYNNTLGNATLANAAGVTVTGTGIPANQWAQYLVTYTAAGTVTMVQYQMGPNVALPVAQFSTAVLSSTTASAGQLTGANFTVMANSGANPGTLTTRTASQMFGDIPNCQAGFSYILRLFNNQGTGVLTLGGAATGVTYTGTMTVAVNSYRDFFVTFPTTTTCTIQSLGVGGAGP